MHFVRTQGTAYTVYMVAPHNLRRRQPAAGGAAVAYERTPPPLEQRFAIHPIIAATVAGECAGIIEYRHAAAAQPARLHALADPIVDEIAKRRVLAKSLQVRVPGLSVVVVPE